MASKYFPPQRFHEMTNLINEKYANLEPEIPFCRFFCHYVEVGKWNFQNIRVYVWSIQKYKFCLSVTLILAIATQVPADECFEITCPFNDVLIRLLCLAYQQNHFIS